MRIAIAVLVLVAAGAMSDTAKADPYRWCAEYGGDRGGRNCYFLTLEQCRWAVSGTNTAHCQPNPFYDGRPIVTPEDGVRARRRP